MIKDGQCYIVDPSFPLDKEEWLENIYGFVIAWSNGKRETYDFLTSDFPVKLKETFDKKLEKKKAKFDGEFPVTGQSKA